jgi:hypothetical protein
MWARVTGVASRGSSRHVTTSRKQYLGYVLDLISILTPILLFLLKFSSFLACESFSLTKSKRILRLL